MGSTWQVTSEERDQVVRDAFTSQMASEQAILFYGYLLVVVIVIAVLGGVPAALGGIVSALIGWGVIAWVWRRQLRRSFALAYPDGSTAECSLVGDRLRLVHDVASTEIRLEHLRKPRVVGQSVSVIRPGARFRRMYLPRALAPDEVLARIS